MQEFDSFNQIADDSRHFDNQGEIFLCRNWNSRVGLMSDTVEIIGLDRFVDLPDDNDLSTCSTVRVFNDKTVNVFRHKLTSLYKIKQQQQQKKKTLFVHCKRTAGTRSIHIPVW